MFGILSRRRHPTSTARPVNRARPQCEPLGERVNPTSIVTGTFSASGMLHVTGEFSVDEDLLDYDDPEQVIPLNNFELDQVGPWYYTVNEDPVEAVYHYGQFYSMEFTASGVEEDGDPAPSLAVDVVGNTADVWLGDNPNPFEHTVNVALPKAATVDFSTATTGKAYRIRVHMNLDEAGSQSLGYITVTANATTTDIRNLVKSALEQAGYGVVPTGDTKLEIRGKEGMNLRRIDIDTMKIDDDVIDMTLSGPKLIGVINNVKVYVNGTLLTP